MAKKLPDIFQEERPFNMAVIFLERLNTRLDEAQLSAIDADLLRWYRVLKAIYRQIHFKVIEAGHEKAESELIDEFNQIKKYLQNILNSPQNAANAAEFQKSTLSEAEIKLDNLEIKLNDLLYKYKLIFPDLSEKERDKNVTKFIEKYVKKRVIKKALADPSYIGIKENADNKSTKSDKHN